MNEIWDLIKRFAYGYLTLGTFVRGTEAVSVKSHRRRNGQHVKQHHRTVSRRYPKQRTPIIWASEDQKHRMRESGACLTDYGLNGHTYESAQKWLDFVESEKRRKR